MSQRYYSSTAVQTTGTAGINGVQTTMTVGTTSGWPTQYPFLLVLNENQADEELVDVTNVSGLTVTMTRGVDGTSAQTHTIGFTVKHGFSGRDFRDSRTHEGTGSGVHGLSGSLVDDSTPQTLSNKTLNTPLVTGTFPTHAHTGASDGGAITALVNHTGASTNVHGLTGGAAVVGDTSTQNLTNKTLTGATAQPANANTKGFLVKGLSSQADNISEVQLSDGTPKWWVDALGKVNVGPTLILQSNAGQPAVQATAFDVNTVPAVVRGLSGQISDLLQVQDFTNTPLASISATGVLTTNGLVVDAGVANTQTGLLAQSGGIAAVPITAQGAAGQTANLQEWKNDTGAVKASVDPTGKLTSNGLPYAMATGSLQFAFGGGNTLSTGIAFPSSRFTQVPNVVVGIASSPSGSRPVTCRVSSISSAGCTITVNSVDSTAMSGTWQVDWIAMQATATSADG